MLPAGASHREVVAAYARGCLIGARGNSGVIVSQYLAALLTEIDAHGGLNNASGADIAIALDVAAAAAYDAVGDPVEGTILSVARAAADGARDTSATGAGAPAVAVAAVVAGRTELARTTSVLREARLAGVVDAGAAGLLLQLEVLAETIAGASSLAALDEVEWEVNARIDGVTPAAAALAGGGPATSGSHEVMFLSTRKRLPAESDANPDEKPPKLKTLLKRIGDSVAVTGTDSLFQAHVHTDTPARAIEVARSVGAAHMVVNNIAAQYAARHHSTAIVAMTAAPGLAPELTRAGATVVAIPDPTKVDLQQLARTVGDMESERVALVAGTPALQAAALALDDDRVSVIAATTEPQLVAAVAAAALSDSASDVIAEMEKAAAGCRVAPSTMDALAEDLRRLIGDDDDVATVILGDGVSRGVAETGLRQLAAERADVHVQVFDGGQATPSVLLGVESAEA